MEEFINGYLLFTIITNDLIYPPIPTAIQTPPYNVVTPIFSWRIRKSGGRKISLGIMHTIW